MELKCLVLRGPEKIFVLPSDVKVWFRSVCNAEDRIVIGEGIADENFCLRLAERSQSMWNGLFNGSWDCGDMLRFSIDDGLMIVAGGTVKKGKVPEGYGYETMSLLMKVGLGEFLGISIVEKL